MQIKGIHAILSIILFGLIFMVAVHANTTIVNFQDWTKVQIVSPLESNGAIPINIQDQHSRVIGILMSQAVSPAQTLGNDTIVGSYDINMTAGHTFVAGNEIFLVQINRSFHALVLSVSGNTLTVNSPMDQVYTVSKAIVLEVVSDMTVDGSTTAQAFSVQLGTSSDIELDITGLRMVITDNLAMDDGTFGGISALPRGIVFRIKHDDGYQNLWTTKTNGKLGLVMDHKVYSNRAPAGEYAVSFIWQIANDNGVTLRLEAGDKIEVLIQDDLTALSTMKIWVYGHEVTT